MNLSAITSDEMLLDNINALYKNIWNQPVKESLIKHSSYRGFKGYVVLTDDREVLGFSYGYSSAPGQYYHDLLSRELETDEYEHWLKDAFEVVELAVNPSHRNKGNGKLLVKALLEGVTNKTAVLTTQVNNKQARKLYEKLGWDVVTETFAPTAYGELYVIMGKEL